MINILSMFHCKGKMSSTLLIVLSSIGFLFNSCSDKCQVTTNYWYYQPVYATPAEIKAAVSLKSPQQISNPGRIYYKDHILFINESGEGIHIIDNHDPISPQPLGFLNIPGNFDLAIIGNTLYADSFVDLVAFTISDLKDIKEINRIEGLFNHYQSMGFFANNENKLVVDWKPVGQVTIEESDCANQLQSWGGRYYEDGIALTNFAASSFNKGNAAINPSVNTGIGGSMARFTIANNFLYAIDQFNLDIVDVSSPTDPKAKKEISLGWQPETLFPHKGSLFIGTTLGMYIYDLATPENPTLLSNYEHIQSCDPVVVEGDYAYVTLFSGSRCNLSTNELQVIDIKDLKSPTLVKTYPMTNPHGLGIDNGTLFICDGNDGLKIYDAHDVHAISTNQLAHYTNINALDIIPYENIAMMIGSDGLYQYDYTDLKEIKLLSKIAIAKE